MSKLSISAQFQGRPASPSPFIVGGDLNPNGLLSRMERLNARREKREAAAKSKVQLSDATLLLEADAMENAWRFEVAALIVAKRLKTPEADDVAKRARAVTASVVRRIEQAKATTVAGLQVKARAVLWRRNGEPLEEDGLFDASTRDEPIEADASAGQ
jgi:hypothetical protein